jgi:thiamine pyrophosphate-dependent acetolactate synthase large subunit-like protein
MGFFRRQEEKLAIRLLAWQYLRSNLPMPAYSVMEQQAARIVAEAHRIAREKGGSVVSILKDLAFQIGKPAKPKTDPKADESKPDADNRF